MSEAAFERELKAAAKSGKIVLGARRSIKLLLRNAVKGVVISDNAPADVRKTVENLAALNKVPVHTYKGTSVELGSVIGKPFRVSVIAIIDPGDSKILDVISQQA